MPLGEFELIQRYFAQVAEASSDASVVLGVGDDCAILTPPASQQLVVSIDTLVEGTHFLPDTPADLLASRLLGAALSDLAAMGAQPAWLTLALSLPTANAEWLKRFSDRLAELCLEFKIALVGGDTTRGPLTLTAQVHGFVPEGAALVRSGAQVDDLICVSGTLGDSRAGLEAQLKGLEQPGFAPYLSERFFAPSPRIALGLSLREFAHSCIDISDGLLSDLAHILKASGGLGARLQLEALPLSDAILKSYGQDQARQWALTGGEDFELCFTIPADKLAVLAHLPAPIAVIGKVTQAPDICLFDRGIPCEISGSGYDHFLKQSPVE